MVRPAGARREKASDVMRGGDPVLAPTPDAPAPARTPPAAVPREKARGDRSDVTPGDPASTAAPVTDEPTATPKGRQGDRRRGQGSSGGGSPKGDAGRRRRRGGRRRTPASDRPAVDRVMLVHAAPAGTQIALLEEDRIVEHFVTRSTDRTLVGNIYMGRVQNVLPGMEASFVDVGEGRNGVLYAGEVGLGDDDAEETPRIETVLKPGQSILVQVTKDPMRAKGPRLTAAVSLAGRHLVLVPGGKTLGVSRKLADAERTRLRDIAQRLRPEAHGLIVRTVAEGASEADLERDLQRLVARWEDVERRAKQVSAPALLYQEPDLEVRVIRDAFNQAVARCVVDDAELASTLRDYIRTTTPELAERLELYEGPLPIFEEFRVLEQIRKSLDRRVWLPSGGHIVIDRTEAMTVVDVNTGKFVGKSNLEETVFRTNKEAAVEVARQLRLRDIGGIIVIDFIDMEIASNRDEVLRVFRAALDRDRTRTQVFEMSPLGLIQMTRKSVSTGIVEAFSDACPTCEGRGIVVHDVD